MSVPPSHLQALALRIVAGRVEAGGSISGDLADALAHEVDRHPEDAEELAAAASLAGERVPDWHLAELEARDAEEGGDSWRDVEARIHERLQVSRRTT